MVEGIKSVHSIDPLPSSTQSHRWLYHVDHRSDNYTESRAYIRRYHSRGMHLYDWLPLYASFWFFPLQYQADVMRHKINIPHGQPTPPGIYWRPEIDDGSLLSSNKSGTVIITYGQPLILVAGNPTSSRASSSFHAGHGSQSQSSRGITVTPSSWNYGQTQNQNQARYAQNLTTLAWLHGAITGTCAYTPYAPMLIFIFRVGIPQLYTVFTVVSDPLSECIPCWRDCSQEFANWRDQTTFLPTTDFTSRGMCSRLAIDTGKRSHNSKFLNCWHILAFRVQRSVRSPFLFYTWFTKYWTVLQMGFGREICLLVSMGSQNWAKWDAPLARRYENYSGLPQDGTCPYRRPHWRRENGINKTHQETQYDHTYLPRQH